MLPPAVDELSAVADAVPVPELDVVDVGAVEPPLAVALEAGATPALVGAPEVPVLTVTDPTVELVPPNEAALPFEDESVLAELTVPSVVGVPQPTSDKVAHAARAVYAGRRRRVEICDNLIASDKQTRM